MARLELGNRRINSRTKAYFGTYGTKFVAGLTAVSAFMTLVVFGGDFFHEDNEPMSNKRRGGDDGGRKRR